MSPWMSARHFNSHLLHNDWKTSSNNLPKISAFPWTDIRKKLEYPVKTYQILSILKNHHWLRRGSNQGRGGQRLTRFDSRIQCCSNRYIYISVWWKGRIFIEGYFLVYTLQSCEHKKWDTFMHFQHCWLMHQLSKTWKTKATFGMMHSVQLKHSDLSKLKIQTLNRCIVLKCGVSLHMRMWLRTGVGWEN